MQQESRVKKTLLNARVNLIFYFLTLVLSFFSRKIFLDCLGAGFVGLTGTLQNLLGFLNLAELGIGSAIGYVLYRPLFEGDRDRINEIISVMGYLYRWIGLAILGAGLLLACFLPLIFPDADTGFSLPLVYFAYFSFLASSLIGYFINYRQNLLGADQRNYVVTGYFQTVNIVKTIVQMASAWYTRSYFLWVAIELSFGIAYSFILNYKINQTYPWLKTELRKGRIFLKKYPLIIKNTKRIFLHKIGIITQWQAMPFLIYAFVSLKMVAYYENYTLLASKLLQLLNSVLGSSEAGVGNLIAEGDKAKVESVLWEMMAVRYWILGGIGICLYCMLPPFIRLWIGEEYILPISTLTLIIINIGIQATQSCLGQFIYGYGLFNDVWATLTQAAVFLAAAFFGGKFFGLNGIIASSILSLFLAYCVWKPYYLYHFGLKKSIFSYLTKWIRVVALCTAAYIGTFAISGTISIDPNRSYASLLAYCGLVASTYIAVSVPLFVLLDKHFRKLVRRFIK